MNRSVLPTRRQRAGFTLIELLTVIAIIGILMALLFPAVQGALDNAKKAQAKNDIMQTITAVKGFYTEYSRYPAVGTGSGDTVLKTADNNAKLLNSLRYKTNEGQEDNPRGIVFFEGKVTSNKKGGIDATDGAMYDPWGNVYMFVIDTDYDNLIDVSDIGNAPPGGPMTATMAGSSFGKNKEQDPPSGGKKDDVVSW